MADIRIYIKEIDSIDEKELDAVIASLPQWRRDKVMAYKHQQGRKESAVAFSLLQQALQEQYGIGEDIEFEYNEHGKPLLKGHPEVHFNMSHCKKAVACVVGEVPVGIDVEMRGRYKESLARHVLSAEEMDIVEASEDKDLAFTRFWTQKEALVKLIGTGVSTDMKGLLAEHKDKKITTTECDGYVCSVAE